MANLFDFMYFHDFPRYISTVNSKILFLYFFEHEISRETLGGKNSNAPLLWDASVVSILNEAEKGHLVWSSINVWAIHELREKKIGGYIKTKLIRHKGRYKSDDRGRKGLTIRIKLTFIHLWTAPMCVRSARRKWSISSRTACVECYVAVVVRYFYGTLCRLQCWLA